jgi:uncharacterized protein YkwD
MLPPLVVAALALAGIASAGPNPVSAPVADTAGISAVTGLEQQTLLAINAVRRDNGLVPLRLNRGLAAAARGHSLSMAEHGFFQHASYDGSAFWRRIKPVYPPAPGRYWGAGENMVWASPDLSAQIVIDMWMKSPEHRKNLLTPAWREVGVGGIHALAAPGVYQGLDVTIVTADFGVR